MGNTNSGRGGLPREKKKEVERLIRAGKKNAEIARTTGIDVSTVSRYKRRLREEAAAGESAEDNATERCPCGARVLLSVGYCISCHLRKTVLEPARRKNLEKLRRPPRSQKARLAA